MNPLGFQKTYAVDSKAFDELRRISVDLGFAQEQIRARNHFLSDKEIGAQGADEIKVFGANVVRAKECAVSAQIDGGDLEENLRWIREARRQADWVIYSLHYHELGGNTLKTANTLTAVEDPALFIIDAAHAAIDAGADIVVGHGPHILLGAEIYKGRPIFYSLGSFIFQNETVPFFPHDAYERFDLDMNATPADFIDVRTGNGKKGHVAHAGYWENAALECSFSGGKLSEVRVLPVDQGFGRPRAQRGRPVLATGDVANRILTRLARISKRYGTDIRIVGDTGIIHVDRS